jgi:prevent-host-death family protein
MEVILAIKSVSSTQIQNNFGQVLDDITQNHTRYIVERRGSPKAVILSFDDFERVLGDAKERQEMGSIIKELRPEYGLGHIVSLKPKAG